MGVVKGSFIARESLFKNHKYVVALNTTSEKYQAYVVLNPDDDINQVSLTSEMSYFIDDWSYEIIRTLELCDMRGGVQYAEK